jgi:hypothetical protein
MIFESSGILEITTKGDDSSSSAAIFVDKFT